MHICLFLSLWWVPGAWTYAKREKKRGGVGGGEEDDEKEREKKCGRHPVWAKQPKPNEQQQQQQIYLK